MHHKASRHRKGRAASSPVYFEIATQPAIVDRVAAILGDDVMLCGASLTERAPDQIHPWHTDVHLALSPGRAVTVWLGLDNVTVNTALRMIAGSHR